jgi:hypothetical protein
MNALEPRAPMDATPGIYGPASLGAPDTCTFFPLGFHLVASVATSTSGPAGITYTRDRRTTTALRYPLFLSSGNLASGRERCASVVCRLILLNACVSDARTTTTTDDDLLISRFPISYCCAQAVSIHEVARSEGRGAALTTIIRKRQ